MLSYNESSRNPVKFLALTGYTVEEFQALLPRFHSQFDATMKVKTLDDKQRLKRCYTNYRNSPLPTIEDKLLFILVYLKQGTIQEVHASLFGMYQPDANQWIHLLHPILNQTLAELGELPVRKAEDLKLPAVANMEEGNVVVYFHDGTERPVPRPKDQEAQKQYYSGKKTAHGQEHSDQQYSM
jgi:Helix-turn-helix of DDE superfamily endonuclease